MAEFATADFALEVRQKDGYTLREHLQGAWDQSGIKPPELDVPPLPECAAYVWEYFVELHNRRGNNGFGHVPLSYSEIGWWKRLTRRSLDPWELKAILEIDAAYLASIAKKPTEGS